MGTFDFEALDFVDEEAATVYHFPRNENCEMVSGKTMVRYLFGFIVAPNNTQLTKN